MKGLYIFQLKIKEIFLISLSIFLLISCKNKTKENEELKPEQTTNQSSSVISYKNPLEVKVADPFILDNGDGTYYLYGSGGGAEDGFSTYSSTNLVDWKYEGQIFHGNLDDTWSESAFWAPECYKVDGKYYLFYSANWKYNPTNEEENFHIGVAVSDQPTGPFVDLEDEPLFEPGYPVIDANVFQDDDGKYYLYYSRACYKHPVESEIATWAKNKGLFEEIEESWVYGVELSPDFKSVIGEPQLILRPPLKMDNKNAEWESRSITSKEINRRWTEGSFTFKHKDKYYIMYSANYYAGENYAVGYAVGDSPLGPFEKSNNNPVLEKNAHKGGEVTGTGHNSVLFLNNSDKMLCVYHGRTKATGDERVVFIDEMTISENGILKVSGPSTSLKKIKL